MLEIKRIMGRVFSLRFRRIVGTQRRLSTRTRKRTVLALMSTDCSCSVLIISCSIFSLATVLINSSEGPNFGFRVWGLGLGFESLGFSVRDERHEEEESSYTKGNLKHFNTRHRKTFEYTASQNMRRYKV